MVLLKDPSPLKYSQEYILVAAGTAGTAAAASGRTEFDIGIQVESHAGEIDFYFFSLNHEFFVNDKLKAFYVKLVISVFRLIQSHCKRWAPSAAGIEKNSDRGGFTPLEVIIDLRFCRICQLNHCITLLIYYRSNICV